MTGSFNEKKSSEQKTTKIIIISVLVLLLVASILNIIITVVKENERSEFSQQQVDEANALLTGQQPEKKDDKELVPDPGSNIREAATAALATKVATLENQLSILRAEQAKIEKSIDDGLEQLGVEQKKIALQTSQDISQITALIESQLEGQARIDRESVISEGELNFEESGGVIFESTNQNTMDAEVPEVAPKSTGYAMFRSSKPPANTAVDSSLFEVPEIPESEDEYVTFEIPGNAFASAETLYGVHCPIVSNVVAGMAASGGGLATPVVLPIRSHFKGPNGDIKTVGTASILAECSGQRTSDNNVGRAVLELKKISFVDDSGEAHWQDIEGTVIDRRTETIYIDGPIDKARTSNIWTRAVNAAISTAAFGFSAQGVVLTKSDGQGGYEQTFEGDPIKDMAAQGIGGYFTDIQAGFAEMMNAAIDTVGLPSGRDVRVVLTQPVSFKVKVKKNDFYSSNEDYMF